jgi:sugar/nucleoside kinase (ribokinase family)
VTDRDERSSLDQPQTTKRPASSEPRAQRAHLPPDYVVVGHISADIQPDGSVVLGGTALYSALVAAKLGWRTGILTRGRYGFAIDGLDVPELAIKDDRIQVVVEEAEWPTFFVNDYSSGRRIQHVPRWAGPIDLRGMPPSWRSARVMHLGPVAQEIDVRQMAGINPRFLGITPQGWMRDWPRGSGGRVKPVHLRLPREFISTVDGIVVNDEEWVYARDSVDAVGRSGYGIVTLGSGGAQAFTPAGHFTVPAFPLPVVDLTGAGDVFSAAFFYRISEPGVTTEDALRFANAAAGLSLAGLAISEIPSRRAIKRLLDRTGDGL